MEVDTLAKALSLVPEQLGRMLWGDTGAGVNRLSRVPQSFYRDAFSRLFGGQAGSQDHGVERLRVFILPVLQESPSPI